MKKWPMVKLGDVCKFMTGGTPKSSNKAYYENGEIPWLVSGDIHKTEIFDCDGRITAKGTESSNAKILPKDSVLIALNGQGKTRGTVALLRMSKATCNQSLVSINPVSREQLLPEFLFYQLRGMYSRIRDITGDAERSGLSILIIRTIQIALPTSAEQERIVKLLDGADGLRKLRARADQRTAALIPALFHEMFGDPSKNSKGWRLLPAGDLMAACDYGTSQKANEAGQGVPVLRMGNVTPEGLLNLEDLKTVELAEDELSKHRLNAGDVLFNRTNSRELVGKTGMWDGRFEAVAASYFIRVRFRSDIEHPQHFTTFMNLPFMKRRLAETARGAVGQANINSQELKSLRVPVPPLPLQKEFAQRVAEIRELEANQAASRTRLDALFQSMLHRAFNGGL